MKSEEINKAIAELFGPDVQAIAPNSWQIETPNFRLLILLSEDESWLRALIPITTAQEAQPFLEQLLEANFTTTLETRYALHQNVLWAVFQHNCETLTPEDFSDAVKRLVSLHAQGLNDSFSQLIENRIRQIIQVAKLQGQSIETTLQTLDRFYEEGLMGDLNEGAAAREATLAAWRYQLERLWPEVNP
jgi:Tir chaperone protein (CesT) family